MPKKKIKAIGLLSGGLDSMLAAALIKSQGIEVTGFNFSSAFFQCKPSFAIEKAARQLKIPVKKISNDTAYLKILRNPKHGYGSAINPCIDCKIFILKKAKKFAKKINAKFVFTGEVLGQRPMSQRFETLQLIAKEAGLKGKLLRPLSAKLLPETEAEKKHWIDRSRLLAIQGRQRKAQFELAEKFGIKQFPSPAGGCLLTSKEFALKLSDFMKHNKKILLSQIELLKIGRHFRSGKNKIIVGRRKEENERLIALKQKSDFVFEVPNVGSPIALLQGPKTKKAIALAAQLALRYSDCRETEAAVEYKIKNKKKEIIVPQISEKEIEKLRIVK